MSKVRVSGPAEFGSYGATANAPHDLTMALDRPPASKLNGSLDFADADKRWLQEIGVTTAPEQAHPIPDFTDVDQNWLNDVGITTSADTSQKHNTPNTPEKHQQWFKDIALTSSTSHQHRETWETAKQHDRHKHRRWNESYRDRLLIRAGSRGVVGAAFYAAANMGLEKAMRGYTRRDAAPKGILQHIARFIDVTVGNSIEGVGSLFYTGTKSEIAAKTENLVKFRPTVMYAGHRTPGRSLGSEVVNVTFDFACMSFGDYMTRYVIGIMDPNARKHWMKDGHIDIPAALRDLLTNLFRGVTYAAGEDMAVAIPYVYGMRLQRNIIDKYSPGFKYDSDRGLNGGSFKVKDGKVVGDYQLEGMLDLMGRFSWYNVGTKMFRDAYSGVETKVAHWWHDDRKLHMPNIDPESLKPKSLLISAAHGVRYVVRTTLKVMAYMLPSTFFFFITRTPQSRVRGAAIDVSTGKIIDDVAYPDGLGILSRDKNAAARTDASDKHSDPEPVVPVKRKTKKTPSPVNSTVTNKQDSEQDHNASDVSSTGEEGTASGRIAYVSPHIYTNKDVRSGLLVEKPSGKLKIKDGNTQYFYLHTDANGVQTKIPLEKLSNPELPFTTNPLDAASNAFYATPAPWYNRITNPIAKFCYNAGTTVRNLLVKADDKTDRIFENSIKFTSTSSPEHRRKQREKIDGFARRWVNASVSYAPYFGLKTDVLSAAFDTDRTDMAIDRTLDGIATLNGHEIKAGLKEIRRAAMLEPFADPNREQIAQEALWNADPEHKSNEAYQSNGVSFRHSYTISPDGKKTYVSDDLKAKKAAPATYTHLKARDTSWAAQEALRKFQESDTQGQSVH